MGPYANHMCFGDDLWFLNLWCWFSRCASSCDKLKMMPKLRAPITELSRFAVGEIPRLRAFIHSFYSLAALQLVLGPRLEVWTFVTPRASALTPWAFLTCWEIVCWCGGLTFLVSICVNYILFYMFGMSNSSWDEYSRLLQMVTPPASNGVPVGSLELPSKHRCGMTWAWNIRCEGSNKMGTGEDHNQLTVTKPWISW